MRSVRVFALAVAFPVLGLMAQDKRDEPPVEVRPAKMALMPADFLDNVGQQAKARWRQCYREESPVTTSERPRNAFNLGTLVADSYLAQQAGDVQQFKNTNQDLMNYCKILGFGEKLAPAFLAGAKMAEREDWAAVRKQVSDIQMKIEKIMMDQRDEDLATLVELGMWMRLFHITTYIVANSEDIRNKTLAVGSPKLLDSLKSQFDKMTEATRKNESLGPLGTVIDQLQRHWTESDGGPKPEPITFSLEKLGFLMDRLTKP